MFSLSTHLRRQHFSSKVTKYFPLSLPITDYTHTHTHRHTDIYTHMLLHALLIGIRWYYQVILPKDRKFGVALVKRSRNPSTAFVLH